MARSTPPSKRPSSGNVLTAHDARHQAAQQTESRLCTIALLGLMLLFVVSVWPTLYAPPLGLDDRSLLESLRDAPLSSIFTFDHFGHLRPIKSLFFLGLSRYPDLLWLFRSVALAAALGCAWLTQALTLTFGVRPLLATMSAALWLFNPTTVTATAWLAVNNYVFALLGMLAYLLALDAVGREPAEPARLRARWFFAHFALLLAVLSHELAGVAPLWWLLRSARTQPDRAQHQPAKPRARKPSTLLASAAVVSIPWLLRALQSTPPLSYRSAQLPALELTATAAQHFGDNLALWLLPWGRFGVLLTPASSAGFVWPTLAWLGALLLGWLGFRLARRDGFVACGLSWLLLSLLPVVDLVPLGNTPVAMHYLIIAGVGLAWLLTRSLAGLASRWPRWSSLGAALGAAVVLLAWQPAFRRQVFAWSHETRLYEATVRNYPNNIEARVNLIALHLQAKRFAHARSWLDDSLARAPDNHELLKNQLSLLMQTQPPAEVLRWLDAHRGLSRVDPDVELQRGLVLLRLGASAEAATVLEHVLSRSAPKQTRWNAGYQLANLWVQQGQLDKAHELLRELDKEFPNDAAINLALRLLQDARNERRAR